MKQYSLRVIISMAMAVVAISCVSSPSDDNEKFTVSNKGEIATIYVSADEPYSVRRAVGDLQSDLELVTGLEAKITSDLNDLSGQAIIISTLKNSDLTALLASVEECKGMDGMLESFLVKTLDKSLDNALDRVLPNVDSALLVVGSDALGAIYGTYEISQMAGVSPIYWWVDSTPKRVPDLAISKPYILPHEPSVRFRAIFINDEEAMIKWSNNTTPGGANKGITPETYERVFELMLRLKSNTIWPSMMEAGQYFFQAKDENGVAINPKNATDYGVYVGTSHCENMARNNYDEWYGWAEANAAKYNIDRELSFDYTVNPVAIEAYWQERLDECKEFNMIYTLGIRGISDSAMLTANMKDKSLENKVKMLQTVITHQRQMIKNTFGAEDAVPQIFVPYEETGELYNGESKNGKEKCKGLDIPEDVILVATEDNYGYVRQSPNERDLRRSGGNGIYYHLVYQGYPSPYDWLSLVPLAMVREQLRKVYDEGSMKFWVVNVGDVKPTEIGLKYFMDTAWDVDATYAQPTNEYVADVAQQIYGVDRKMADKCADLLKRIQQCATSQKPEFMTCFWSVDFYNRGLYRFYSHFDFGDEAQRVIERYRGLEAEAKAIYEGLNEAQRAPFYHTIYYPIRATRMMSEKSYYYQRNYYYSKQGRFRAAAGYKSLALRAEEEIQADLRYYNNELSDGRWRDEKGEIKGGKWNGIMDPYGDFNLTERVYDIAGIPNNLMFEEGYEQQAEEGLGAVCEGQAVGDEDVELIFSSLEENSRFIDIFTTGLTSQGWSISSDAEWLKFSQKGGEIDIEQRVFVTADYSKLSQQDNRATITVRGENFSKSFKVLAQRFDFELEPRSYVEGSGFVSIEAEHYTSKVDGEGGAAWVEYEDYGYVGSSMFVKRGAKIEGDIKAKSARLEYRVYFASAGAFTGMLYRIPTLNEGKGKSCEVAIGVDEAEPYILRGIRHKGQFQTTKMANGVKESRRWHTNVIQQMEKIPFAIEIDKPGYHTIKIYQVDNNIGVDRLLIATNDHAAQALDRAIVAAPMSYNNITKYERIGCADLPSITLEEARIEPYPEPEPMLYVKHLFSQYGAPAVWGFTPVSVKHIYDPRINTFGWDASSRGKIGSTHNESTRVWPHWQRDMIMGRQPTKFYIKLLRGRYDVTLYTGTIRYTYAYDPSKDLQFSVKANGKTVIDNEFFKENSPTSRTFEARVGDDNCLEIEFFGGLWGVSAIEVYRK